MPVWRQLVAEAAETLRRAGVDETEADIGARRIGWEATGTGPGDWHEVAEQPPTQRQLASFDRMVARRSDGEPLQYVLGSWGFRTLDLMVDRRVLIPRPETEVVAGFALTELDRVATDPQGPTAGRTPIVADLGTGSGAIGLAVAAERPGTEVWLTDESADAIEVARANLAGLGRAGRGVRIATGDWFEALPIELRGSLAVVVANPPYVASAAELEPAVAEWEPPGALVAADEGRVHLDHLVEAAPTWLLAAGALVLEMDPRQVGPVAERAAAHFDEVDTVEDLAGRLRAVVARRPRHRS